MLGLVFAALAIRVHRGVTVAASKGSECISRGCSCNKVCLSRHNIGR